MWDGMVTWVGSRCKKSKMTEDFVECNKNISCYKIILLPNIQAKVAVVKKMLTWPLVLWYIYVVWEVGSFEIMCKEEQKVTSRCERMLVWDNNKNRIQKVQCNSTLLSFFTKRIQKKLKQKRDGCITDGHKQWNLKPKQYKNGPSIALCQRAV